MGSVQSEVQTSAGAVRGRWEDGVAVFRGIPFAAPPVGAFRFAAPEPAERRDGSRRNLVRAGAAAAGPDHRAATTG